MDRIHMIILHGHIIKTLFQIIVLWYEIIFILKHREHYIVLQSIWSLVSCALRILYDSSTCVIILITFQLQKLFDLTLLMNVLKFL